MSECNSFSSSCLDTNLPSELLYLFARKISAISCMACSWLVLFTCIFPIDTCLSATSVHRSDDSTHESSLPLLNTCAHSTFSFDASLLLSTCVLSIDTCLSATSVHASDGFSQSPLPNVCTHSTFSTLVCCCFDIYLPLAFATCSSVWHAWSSGEFTHDSALLTFIYFTLASAFAFLVSLHDLSVTESSTDSTPFWLFLLAAMLWQDALARVKGILLSFYYSFRWSTSPQDSEESKGATCTFVRSIFRTSGSGQDSRNPPLPSSLWHFALAILHGIIVTLICITCKNFLASMFCLLATCREQIGMMALCRQFTFHISLDDIDSSLDIEQSIQATCTSPRLDVFSLEFRLGSAKPIFTIICDNHDPTNCGERCSDMGI